jgi:hypothetical protein
MFSSAYRLSNGSYKELGIKHTIVYSGFSHFCFWQCSDSRLTGNLPVHEAPPIRVLVSGFLGVASFAFAALAVPLDVDPNLVDEFGLLLESSLGLSLEFVNTI